MRRRELTPVEPWPALIESGSVRALQREIGRAMAAGELAAVGPITPNGGGRYFVEVLRLRDRQVAPAWRKPLLVASGAVVSLAGLAGLGWWLASATAAAVSAVSLPVLATLGALAWLSYRALSSGGGCETTVTVRHRHW